MDKRANELRKANKPTRSRLLKGEGRKLRFKAYAMKACRTTNKIKKLKRTLKKQPTNQLVINALRMLGVVV
jgi:hypothetical protein